MLHEQFAYCRFSSACVVKVFHTFSFFNPKSKIQNLAPYCSPLTPYRIILSNRSSAFDGIFRFWIFDCSIIELLDPLWLEYWEEY